MTYSLLIWHTDRFSSATATYVAATHTNLRPSIITTSCLSLHDVIWETLGMRLLPWRQPI